MLFIQTYLYTSNTTSSKHLGTTMGNFPTSPVHAVRPGARVRGLGEVGVGNVENPGSGAGFVSQKNKGNMI